MKEKDLTSKELLVQKLGMEFDEVAPIFSEETLTSMTMSHVVGGNGETNPGCTFPGCTVNSGCTYPGCTTNVTGDECTTKVKTCEVKVGSCGDGSDTKAGICAPSTKPTNKPTDSPTGKPTAKPASLL